MMEDVTQLSQNASFWDQSGIVHYFDDNRNKLTDVYASEQFFLHQYLKEGMRVLDIGCAQGGFASVLGECLSEFSYTGLDIAPDMIAAARKRHPQHAFHLIAEDDYSILGEEQYDLVLVLGILHVHETWRNTIATAWQHTQDVLLLDLRETVGASIEDKSKAYFNTFAHTDSGMRLPYNLINSSAAIENLHELCQGYQRMQWYGYEHPASEHACIPYPTILMNVYSISKCN